MKETNLLVLLKGFSPYELNKLRKFVNSPYFNKSEKVILLYDLIKRDLTSDKLKSKKFYYKKIYGSEVYQDQKFRNLHSDLFQLTLKFITQEEYEKDYQTQANHLIESVKSRDAKYLYSKAITVAHKLMDKVKTEDGNSFLQKFNLERSIFNLTTEFEKKTNIKKNEKEINVLKINDNLDYFYMIEKLKYYNSYLSWKRIIKSDYEFPYVRVVLAIVKTHKKELPPALQVYYEMYKTSINDNDLESYKNLKHLIAESNHLFKQEDTKGIYESLINFTIKQVNKGNTDFYEELLDTYIAGIESGALLDKGHISPTSFRNICALGLRMKKFQWVEGFIEEKLTLLPPQFRENARKFNMARLYFYQENYEQVISTVQEVEFKDPLYANVSKTLVMMSYYELFNEEALMYFADSFSAYMRRSKGISEKVRKEYLNLIKFAKQLSKARYNKALLPKLKAQIVDSQNLASKQWFLEKLKDVKLPNEE